MRVLLTGGLGFIGAQTVRSLLRRAEELGLEKLVVLDAETYASDRERLGEALESPLLTLRVGDIRDARLLRRLFATHKFTHVAHFAAETDVSRSFETPRLFLDVNARGTLELLEVCREAELERFLHVSTDEVYGECVEDPPATELKCLAPSNPYAASKAAAEMLAHTYWRCFKVPVCVVRANNAFGPGQHEEKVLPCFLKRAALGESLPLQNEGRTVRAFCHTEDLAEACLLLLQRGVVGEVYNVSAPAENERSMRDLALEILRLSGRERPQECLLDIPDRPFNDARYHIDGAKIESLGWRPRRLLSPWLAERVRDRARDSS
jgi:dTDP-glucose 4,6-dehydratase